MTLTQRREQTWCASKEGILNLLFFFPLRQPAGWIMLRGEGIVLSPSSPQTSSCTCLFVTSPATKNGVHFCVLDWEIAVRSRNGRAGNSRLALALCSAPKKGVFQLPEIKGFLYSWEMHIWETNKKKLQKAIGRSWYLCPGRTSSMVGVETLCESFSSAGAVVVNGLQGIGGPSFML